VDVIAAATIAAVALTIAVAVPTAVVAARSAVADVPASASNAVPADQAALAMIVATRVEAITPAPRVARSSFPKCSRPVRM
jgi:hypothetical protein